MSTLSLRLSRWGKSSYETQESIDKEKRKVQKIIPVVEDNSNAEIIVVHSKMKVDGNIIEQCPSLRYVITTTSGYDHLHIEELQKRGIQAIRMPLLRRDAVVETTLGLILQGSRKLLSLRDASIHKGWIRHLLPHFQLMSGQHLRIGVVGSSGVIGSRMCEVLRFLGCKVYHHDIADPNSYSFEDLLQNCNIITLHCNLNPTSYHLCDAQFFKKIERGSMLINTARGGLVDEKAMFDALKKEQVSYVGLDVFEQEPYPQMNIQANDNNLVLLPHAAGFSHSLLDDIAISLVKLCAKIKGGDNIPHLIL